MKIKDLFALCFIAVLIVFFVTPVTRSAYENAYKFSPELISFIKFAILATFGEMAGARIRSGNYYSKEFGLLPKALIWGLLGAAISIAFRIFSGGVGSFPVFADVNQYPGIILKAFTISFLMNIIFAPVMMLTHKVTDQHIADGGGRFYFKNINISDILSRIDWAQFWGFLMKKTIPFFWIPAHTVTFLLPAEFRTLFAAILSIFLGVFLSIKAAGRQMNNE